MPVSSDPTTHRIIRFGVFEVDLEQRELRPSGAQRGATNSWWAHLKMPDSERAAGAVFLPASRDDLREPHVRPERIKVGIDL